MKRERIFIGALFLLAALFSAPAWAIEPRELGGRWEVLYDDKELGGIRGKAFINSDGGSARVVLEHRGREYELNSTALTVRGDTVTLTLEGESPYTQPDVPRFGEDPVAAYRLPEETREIRFRTSASILCACVPAPTKTRSSWILNSMTTA